MQKDALTTTLTTLVISIFGAFLRWLQTLNAFEEGTGLAIPGAATSIVFLVYSILAVTAILVLTVLWLRRCNAPAEPENALKSATVAPVIIGWAAAAIAAAGCIKLMFSASFSAFPMLARIFAAAGIIMAPCLPMLFPGRSGGKNPNGRAAGVYVTVFACFWLVYCYRTNAENPIVWLYGLDILAVCAVTLAYYYICAYYYGKAKPKFALLTSQLGAYFSISALFGADSFCTQALLFSAAMIMLTFEFLIIRNLKEKQEI